MAAARRVHRLRSMFPWWRADPQSGQELRCAVALALVVLVGCASKSQEEADATSGSVGGDGGGGPGSGGSSTSGSSTSGSGGSSTSGSGGSSTSGSDSGSGGSGTGGGGAGAPPVDCYAHLSHVSPPLVDPEDGYQFDVFELTDDGAVAVLGGVQGNGYRVIELDASNAPRGEIQHLWQDDRIGSETRLAVAGDVLAVVDLAQEGDYQRPVCRLGLARLGGVQSLVAPIRFSDEPGGETILNEALWCDVTRAGDGFLVAWQQVVSDITGEFSLFAQRFDVDGEPVGERLTLPFGDKAEGQVTLVSDGDEALMAQLVDETIELTVFDEDDTRTLVVEDAPLQSPPEVLPVDDGLLLRGGDRLVLVDREGQRVAGPTDITARLVAPLAEGYVVVQSEEFLVARTLDGELLRPSAPSGLSDDRRAYASSLLFARDGQRVALVYSEDGQQRLATLECGPEPVPLGPQLCAEAETVEPLDVGCEDAICHVLVRLDAQTLGLRGYAVLGGDDNPIDASEAFAAVEEVFAPQWEYLIDNTEISGPEAGIFSAYAQPLDSGGFALVSAESGLVLAAGGIIWSGTGHYWLPEVWQPATELTCGSEAIEPEDRFVVEGGCGLDSPSAAVDVVLRSNLAAHLAERGSFTAYGYLYTPTEGVCDPRVAEYLVVLTQRRD